jgi:hypothetical protein
MGFGWNANIGMMGTRNYNGGFQGQFRRNQPQNGLPFPDRFGRRNFGGNYREGMPTNGSDFQRNTFRPRVPAFAQPV